MPSEVRHLLFRAPEVVNAVQAHFRRIGKPLPSGSVGDCTCSGDGVTVPVSFQLTLHTDFGRAGMPDAITVDTVNLVAALIMHCKDKKIPLPAKAQKSLQRINDQICLVATLN